MKKTYLVICLLFFIGYVSAQKISAEVLYTCKLNNNPFANELANEKKMDTTPIHVKQMHEKFVKQSVAVNYKLKFNNSESVFEKIKTMSNDVDTGFNLTETMGASGVFYTNLKTQKIINITQAAGETLTIEDNYGNTKWELIKETKQIGKHLCYKATTEYKYMAGRDGNKLIIKSVIAWYTPDISVGHGPAGYGNLPGLIINLEVGDIEYTITKLNLNPKKTVNIKKQKAKGKIMTRSQYQGF